jgi:hypothetical protein
MFRPQEQPFFPQNQFIPPQQPDFPQEVTTSAPVSTTLSPQLQSCIDDCKRTHEYNPLCGTDGQTYNNRGHLRCAMFCGVNVGLSRTGTCAPLR